MARIIPKIAEHADRLKKTRAKLVTFDKSESISKAKIERFDANSNAEKTLRSDEKVNPAARRRMLIATAMTTKRKSHALNVPESLII